jgi:hypothetical protein
MPHYEIPGRNDDGDTFTSAPVFIFWPVGEFVHFLYISLYSVTTSNCIMHSYNGLSVTIWNAKTELYITLPKSSYNTILFSNLWINKWQKMSPYFLFFSLLCRFPFLTENTVTDFCIFQICITIQNLSIYIELPNVMVNG